MIPDSELLKMACEFNLGPEPIVNGTLQAGRRYLDEGYHNVYVKNMGNINRDQPDRWAILCSGRSCLNKEGLWQYQGLPSSRKDEFYDHCRYDSVHEAIEYYQKWKDSIEKWAKETLAQNPKAVLNYEDCPDELRKFGD